MFEWLNGPVSKDYRGNASPIKRKYIAYPVLALFILIFGSCSFKKSFKRVAIDQGTVGVVVAKPIFFGQGGMTGQVFKAGAHWTWKSNEVQVVSTRPFQVKEDFDDMYSSDNIPVDFNAFLNGLISNHYEYIKSWGDRWYADNVQREFRKAVREECKRYTMTELTSDPGVPTKIGNAALEVVRKHVAVKKIPVDVTGITVDKISPNKAVADEIAATAVQQQRQRTEGEKKKAEDMRKATETARAAADNAYREAMNLAPEQYIRLEAVKAFSHAAEVCAANDNCHMILQQPGTSVSGTIPLK